MDLLKQVYIEDNESKYERMAKRMNESGGAMAWEWKSEHVEAMLVKLGFEEVTVDEKTKLRKRKRSVQNKQAATSLAHPGAMAWGPDRGLPQLRQQQQQLSPEDQNRLDQQQEQKYWNYEEDAMHDTDSNNTAAELKPPPEKKRTPLKEGSSNKTPATSEQESARVARQACDQLILRSRLQGGEHPKNK